MPNDKLKLVAGKKPFSQAYGVKPAVLLVSIFNPEYDHPLKIRIVAEMLKKARGGSGGCNFHIAAFDGIQGINLATEDGHNVTENWESIQTSVYDRGIDAADTWKTAQQVRQLETEGLVQSIYGDKKIRQWDCFEALRQELSKSTEDREAALTKTAWQYIDAKRKHKAEEYEVRRQENASLPPLPTGTRREDVDERDRLLNINTQIELANSKKYLLEDMILYAALLVHHQGGVLFYMGSENPAFQYARKVAARLNPDTQLAIFQQVKLTPVDSSTEEYLRSKDKTNFFFTDIPEREHQHFTRLSPAHSPDSDSSDSDSSDSETTVLSVIPDLSHANGRQTPGVIEVSRRQREAGEAGDQELEELYSQLKRLILERDFEPSGLDEALRATNGKQKGLLISLIEELLDVEESRIDALVMMADAKAQFAELQWRRIEMRARGLLPHRNGDTLNGNTSPPRPPSINGSLRFMMWRQPVPGPSDTRGRRLTFPPDPTPAPSTGGTSAPSQPFV